MAYDYTRIVESIFNSHFNGRNIYRGVFYEDLCIMEIPMNKILDIPMFLVPKMSQLNLTSEIEAITVNLHSKGAEPRYKTLDRYMRDVLVSNFFVEGMVKLNNPDTNEASFYYATHGMLLDSNLCPMMVASRRFEMIEGNEPPVFLKDIVYINPSCYLNQNDKINKFLIRKFMQSAVELSLHSHLNTLSIEVGTMPFNFKKVEAPDINTTNEELLQTAIDYADELVL